MHLQINGENKIVDTALTVTQLLHHLGLAEKRIAIEVNRHIVPASQYDIVVLNENDTIEIIHAVGGG